MTGAWEEGFNNGILWAGIAEGGDIKLLARKSGEFRRELKAKGGSDRDAATAVIDYASGERPQNPSHPAQDVSPT